MSTKHRDQSGFTLIEIIVTLTVASILAVLLVQFMGSSVSRSLEPAVSMRASMALQGIFENMNADYKLLLLTDATPLETFKTYVENGNDSTTASAAGTPYYGSYAWNTKYISFDSGDTEATAPCTVDCKVLKVTLSNDGHSFSALFTR